MVHAPPSLFLLSKTNHFFWFILYSLIGVFSSLTLSSSYNKKEDQRTELVSVKSSFYVNHPFGGRDRLQRASKFSTELQKVADQMKNAHLSCFPKAELCQLKNGKFHQPRNLHLLDQDLNFLPCCSVAAPKGSENQMRESCEPVIAEKKRRATSEHIAGISLSDLAKNFGVPITQASRNLNIGLTVLKRKCREFGIHRWPHRKIKSIDGLIRDLQEEVKHREEDHKALMAVTKRQTMLQNERESIERTPFRELEIETERFRQDVFRRKHKARALESQSPSV